MDQYYDRFDDCASFQYAWCLWPRRCYISNKWIFLEIAIRGRQVITGPGEPVIEDRWYNKHEGLLKLMKGLTHGSI